MPQVSFGTVLDDFLSRWERGESPRAEEYLDQLDSREDAVELVYREFCLAEEAGLNPDPASFLNRFSSLGPSLSRLFRLHEAFTASQISGWCERTPLPSEGDEIGHYLLVRELGRGGFARVFLAQEGDLDHRLVVVKVSNKITQEARLLARVHHPNIVEIHWHGVVNDGEFQLIVMPFHGGATLSAVLGELRQSGRRSRSGHAFLAALDRVAAPERPPSGQPRAARSHLGVNSYARAVAWMIARLAEALEHAYRRGVAHGDVKPSNILLTVDGDPMLLDFNLATGWQQHSITESLEDPGGTLAYMAPERLAAVATVGAAPAPRPIHRHRADIYGLGVVLLEALCGHPPGLPEPKPPTPRELAQFLAEARLRGSDALIRQSRASIPPTLRAILARCLAPDPADRYRRAADLAEDLDCWLQDRPLKYADQPAFRPGAVLWLRRQRIAVVIGGLLLATALAFGYTKTVQDAARRHAIERLTRYFDRSDSGIFRFRRFDVSRVVERGDPAENAVSHLAEFGVDQPGDWRQRDDFRYLPAARQEDLELWLAEQALRYAHAVQLRGGPSEWRRALATLDRMSERGAAGPMIAQRQNLARRLDIPDSSPSERAAVPWQEEYLRGVEDELEQRRPQREQAHYQAMLTHRPRSFWGHYRAATVAYRLGDYRGAVGHLAFCIEQHPTNSALRVQLVGCLYELGRFEEALDACNKAVELDPSQPEPFLSRSFIRRRMGQDEARAEDIRQYERLSRQRGDGKLGERRLVWVLPHHFDDPTDESVWDNDLPRRILAVDPDDLDARTVLASQLMHAKKLDEAVRECDEILRVNPDHLWARLSRGSMRLKLQQRGAGADFDVLLAHPRLEEFLRAYPPGINAFLLRAWLLHEVDDVPQALEFVRDGLAYADRLGVNQAEFHYALARLHARAATDDPDHLVEAWTELSSLRASADSFFDRFEGDPAFARQRCLLRMACPPWRRPLFLGR